MRGGENSPQSVIPLLFFANKIFCRSFIVRITFFLSANSTRMCFQPSGPDARLCSRPFQAELPCPRLAAADICQKSRPPSRIFRLQLGGRLAEQITKQAPAPAPDGVGQAPPVVGEALRAAGLRRTGSSRRPHTRAHRSPQVSLGQQG